MLVVIEHSAGSSAWRTAATEHREAATWFCSVQIPSTCTKNALQEGSTTVMVQEVVLERESSEQGTRYGCGDRLPTAFKVCCKGEIVRNNLENPAQRKQTLV